MPPVYKMEPSSCQSQFTGFKAVIGKGEQSLNVDLGTIFLMGKPCFDQAFWAKRNSEARPNKTDIPVFTDHHFTGDIEFFHVISRALE